MEYLKRRLFSHKRLRYGLEITHDANIIIPGHHNIVDGIAKLVRDQHKQ